MNAEQLKTIQQRFTDYAEEFFGDDSFVNFNLHLKLCHSYKVQKESAYIAEAIGLGEEDCNLAVAVGVLHDTGRFPQFLKYKTYSDARSVNHSELGLAAIEENNMLAGVSDTEKDIIITAIKYHGVKEVPAELDGQRLLHTRIVRDADKLDIFRVVLAGYRLYKKDPAKYCYEVEYPENGLYSDEILRAVMRQERVDYRLIKTMDDARLLQLAWAFDMNFAATLKRMTEKRYLENMIEYMPKTDEIRAAADFVLNYVQQRIKQGD